MNNALIEAKQNELHFVDQIIRNLKHLERLYEKGPLKHEVDANVIKHHFKSWCNRQWELTEEINELKGYGTYQPTL